MLVKSKVTLQQQQWELFSHLCDTERDVADIQPTGLPGHLTPHNRDRGGCDGQAIRSHSGQEGCGWNLSRS